MVPKLLYIKNKGNNASGVIEEKKQTGSIRYKIRI